MKLSTECKEQLIVALSPNFFAPEYLLRIQAHGNGNKGNPMLVAAHALRESIERIEAVFLDEKEQ